MLKSNMTLQELQEKTASQIKKSAVVGVLLGVGLTIAMFLINRWTMSQGYVNKAIFLLLIISPLFAIVSLFSYVPKWNPVYRTLMSAPSSIVVTIIYAKLSNNVQLGIAGKPGAVQFPYQINQRREAEEFKKSVEEALKSAK